MELTPFQVWWAALLGLVPTELHAQLEALGPPPITEASPAEQQEVRFTAQQQRAWCLVECHDGELPVCRLYRHLPDLCHRLRELDGQDVTAHAFWGWPLWITKGFPRQLILPDGAQEQIQEGLASLLTAGVEIQEDGFLGVPELVLPAPPSPPSAVVAAPQQPIRREPKSLPPPKRDDERDEPQGDPAAW